MNSPEETQLADDLRHIAQGPSYAPDLDAIERRGRHAQQRALALRGLAATGVVGVAVAGTLVAFRHPAAPGPTAIAGASTATKTAPGKRTTAAPRLENLAYVRQRLGVAQDPPNSVVEAAERVSGSGPAVVWTDPTTGHKMKLQGSGSGKITDWKHDYADDSQVLHYDEVEVNYGSRTWFNLDTHDPGPLAAPVPKNYGGDYYPAANIKWMVDHKATTIVGHPVVDGHHTVELSVSDGDTRWLFYADSQTYLVIRSIWIFPPDLHEGRKTDDYTWVTRTAALTKLINQPQIPAGFSQVAPPTSTTAAG
jgi:hypothetical protein